MHLKILFKIGREIIRLGKYSQKVFDKIGLGKIFDFLTLTFCDVLKILGLPSINVKFARYIKE